jgi:hypothetical protein
LNGIGDERKSLAASGFDYGLNEKPKTANGNSLRQPGLRASPRAAREQENLEQ